MKRSRAAAIQVDLRSKVPAYLQIVEQVRALTAVGLLKPGDQLPTIRVMAGEAHINFNTVARAYRVLDEAGIISTQHGRGTYAVAPPPSARARKARRQALDLLVRDVLAAAARLGCGPEDVERALARSAGRSTALEHSRRRRPSGQDGDRDGHTPQGRKGPAPRPAVKR